MQKTTASEITGRRATHIIVDEWNYIGYDRFNGHTEIKEFELRKIGPKEYGYFLRNKYHSSAVARYKCSHLEAKRRFTVLLVTRRLLK